MSTASKSSSSSCGRYLLNTVIAALGVVAIVGSGGGGGEIESMWVPHIDPPPYVTMSPSRLTVEQGGTAVFTASAGRTLSPPTYQWRRDGATIAGATGATYTLVGANLGDDGAQFSVEVTASNGTATSTGLLQVSRLPGVVYEDSDFPLSNWTVAATADPAQTGPHRPCRARRAAVTRVHIEASRTRCRRASVRSLSSTPRRRRRMSLRCRDLFTVSTFSSTAARSAGSAARPNSPRER